MNRPLAPGGGPARRAAEPARCRALPSQIKRLVGVVKDCYRPGGTKADRSAVRKACHSLSDFCKQGEPPPEPPGAHAAAAASRGLAS